MIGALLAAFDLPQLHPRVAGGAAEHFDEQLLRGEVAAGAGGQISAPGQQLHGPVVDLLIPGHGVGHRLAAFGEGRRVEDDEIILPGLLFQLRQQVEHIGGHAVHDGFQPVAAGVLRRALHRELRHVHGGDMGRAAFGRVQGKGTGVGKAVQHGFALCQLRHRQTVVLLIQEKAGLLPVFKVHRVDDAVFRDVHGGGLRRCFTGQGIPALVLGHPLPLPEGHIVALVDAADLLPILPQHLGQQGKQPVLDALHAQTEGLGHQHAFKPVHRQAGEQVGLSENDAAAAAVGFAHHRLAIVPRVADAALPEGVGEVIVGVAAHQTHPDPGVAVIEAAAQPAAPAAHHVHQPAVLRRAVRGGHFALIDPRVAACQRGFSLGRDGDAGIGTQCFHVVSLL